MAQKSFLDLTPDENDEIETDSINETTIEENEENEQDSAEKILPIIKKKTPKNIASKSIKYENLRSELVEQIDQLKKNMNEMILNNSTKIAKLVEFIYFAESCANKYAQTKKRWFIHQNPKNGLDPENHEEDKINYEKFLNLRNEIFEIIIPKPPE